MSKLMRTCPFCESEVEVVSVTFYNDRESSLNLKCNKCGTTFRTTMSIFNSRPEEDRLLSLLDKQWVMLFKKERENKNDNLRP